MQRYLLVLDTDLALSKELDLQPIDTLLAPDDQAPCEVVVSGGQGYRYGSPPCGA